MRAEHLMEVIARDVADAFRRLWRAPSVTAVAIITAAIPSLLTAPSA